MEGVLNRRPSKMRLATIAVAAVMVVSSCSIGSGSPGAQPGSPDRTDRDNPPATTPAGTTLSPGRTEKPAAGEILRAYDRFWAVAQTIDRRPIAGWRTLLSAVAGEPLLDELLDGLRDQHERGTRQYGLVVPHASVVDLSGRRAVVVDCQDASGSGLLDAATGQVEQVGAARMPVSAVLTLAPGGAWLVTEARYLSDPC